MDDAEKMLGRKEKTQEALRKSFASRFGYLTAELGAKYRDEMDELWFLYQKIDKK